MVGSQWEKFKQSNVARIFLAYAVVAFGLMQVFDYLLPIIEAPLWVAQTLTLLLFLGFPISLLVGWVTQRSIVSTENEALGSEPSYAQNLSRQKLILIGLGSSALFGFLGLILMPYLLDQASFGMNTAQNSNGTQNASFKSLRYQINLGNTSRRIWGSKTDITISPDGDSLVYAQFNRPRQSLFVKDMTSFEEPRVLTQLSMNNQSGYPQFSDDGQWIYYHEDLGIKRIRLEGGTPQDVVLSSASPSGFAVQDQKIIYHNPNSSSLEVLDISSGVTSSIGGVTDKGVHNHTWPSLIPNSEFLLATRGTRGSYLNSSIDAINLQTGEVKQVIPVGFKGSYSNSGHIIFARGESLWAQPFDVGKLETTGDAVPIIFDAEIYEAYGNVGYALSRSGRLVYVSGILAGDAVGTEKPVFVNRLGVERAIEVDTANYAAPKISPNGQMLATTVFSGAGEADIWVYDLEAKTMGRRSFDLSSQRAIWSKDNSRLIFVCDNPTVCSVASNGTDRPTEMFSGEGYVWISDVSDDGQLIVTSGQPRDVYVVDNNSETERLLTSLNLGEGVNEFATLSPNEKWIAYASDETGDFEIYVRPYPNIEMGKWQVSRNGGRFPMWNDKIDELLWWELDSAEVSSAKMLFIESPDSPTEIRIANPEVLFSGEAYMANGWPPVDYNSINEEFVFIKNTSLDADEVIGNMTHLSVIENWFAELINFAPAE